MPKIVKRKKTFVLIIPRFEDIWNSFYAGEVIKGVCLGASRLNIDIHIHISDRADHRTWLDSSLLDTNFVDGMIFADIDNDVNVVKKAIKSGMRCLVLNNYLNIPINCISIDNKKAAFDLVESLINYGHTKIATISGDLSTQAGQLRLDGYKEAMTKHGLKTPQKYITYGHFLRTQAREAAQKLIELKDRPTAVFAASDLMALELIDVAKKKKLNLPSELSIIGFDDNPINSSSSIKLSTVAQPLIEMGRLGVENLNQICNGKAKLPVKLMLPTKFVKGETVQKAVSRN